MRHRNIPIQLPNLPIFNIGHELDFVGHRLETLISAWAPKKQAGLEVYNGSLKALPANYASSTAHNAGQRIDYIMTQPRVRDINPMDAHSSYW